MRLLAMMWLLGAAGSPAVQPIVQPIAEPGEDAGPVVSSIRPIEDILAAAQASLSELGAYRVRLITEERVGGKLHGPMTLQLWVREEPLAIRAEFIGGSGKGRRVLYDSTLRSRDFRVREPGFLGIAGPLWIGLHNSLAYGDTNHPITDVRLGAVLRYQTENMEKAKAFGGYRRTDEGLDARGRYCVRFEAPAKATGLYASKSRICFDPVTALPLEVTDWDSNGLLEHFVFEDLEPHGAEGPETFTLKAAGL